MSLVDAFSTPVLTVLIPSKALSGAGEWRAALSILDRVLKEGEQPGGAMYVAAMAACARGGVSDLALELLERVLVEYPGDKEVKR